MWVKGCSGRGREKERDRESHGKDTEERMKEREVGDSRHGNRAKRNEPSQLLQLDGNVFNMDHQIVTDILVTLTPDLFLLSLLG